MIVCVLFFAAILGSILFLILLWCKHIIGNWLGNKFLILRNINLNFVWLSSRKRIIGKIWKVRSIDSVFPFWKTWSNFKSLKVRKIQKNDITHRLFLKPENAFYWLCDILGFPEKIRKIVLFPNRVSVAKYSVAKLRIYICKKREQNVHKIQQLQFFVQCSNGNRNIVHQKINAPSDRTSISGLAYGNKRHHPRITTSSPWRHSAHVFTRLAGQYSDGRRSWYDIQVTHHLPRTEKRN